VYTLLEDLGLCEPDYSLTDGGNPTKLLADLFADPAARQENDRFFRPSSISFDQTIQLALPDDEFECDGWSISVFGYGYFFPWEQADLRRRFARHPAMLALRAALQHSFGGVFILPPSDIGNSLRKYVIDGEGGWTWFIYESL
jgi:hypothetical protein